MLRMAFATTVHREAGRGVAVCVDGSPCAEHEGGMAAFVEAMGMRPRGYGFAQAKPATLNARWRRVAARNPAVFELRLADVLVLGTLAATLGDLRGLEAHVEEDYAAVVRHSRGLSVAYDGGTVAFAATSRDGNVVVDWLTALLEAGSLGLRYEGRRLTFVDADTPHGKLTRLSDRDLLASLVTDTFDCADRPRTAAA